MYFKILALFLSGAIGSLHAQSLQYLQVQCTGPQKQFLEKNMVTGYSVTDSLTLFKHLNEALIRCNELSFLNASYTQINFSKDTVFAVIHPGVSYRWIKLGKGNAQEDVLSASGFKEGEFSGKVFNPLAYSRRIKRMLQYLESNGYPFATIKLDSVEADSVGLTAQLNLQKNNFIVFDTIALLGEANMHKTFLRLYLGIKEGYPYNEQLIRESNSRLSQLPYIKLAKSTSVYFYGNKAMPFVYLNNRKASSVDGIIGFAPNSQVNNKLLITGEMNLKLQNLFSRGMSVDLNYRSFLANSQDLKFRTVYPYIFQSNLALDYELNLLKLDSTFLDVRNEIGVQYRFIGNDYFKVFYSIQSTSLIEVDTLQIKITQRLPESSDLRTDQYGLGLKLTRYDYFLNPRKGYSVEMTGAVGVKKIIRNPTIEELRFINSRGESFSIYDTIKMEQVQYRFWANADYFIPVGSLFTFRVQATGGHHVAENLFFNELFRIGGIRSLKGFDEQSIFASSYLVANTEFRYLIQQNAHIMLFWNGAWYRNIVREPVVSDTPYGFGAGINFETGAGIFSLYYAAGKQFNNSVQFQNAKIHFGFTTLF